MGGSVTILAADVERHTALSQHCDGVSTTSRRKFFAGFECNNSVVHFLNESITRDIPIQTEASRFPCHKNAAEFARKFCLGDLRSECHLNAELRPYLPLDLLLAPERSTFGGPILSTSRFCRSSSMIRLRQHWVEANSSNRLQSKPEEA